MNLLPHKKPQIAFAGLDQEELTQFVLRMRSVLAFANAENGGRDLVIDEHSLASALEEIEAEPTAATVGELLDSIERSRIRSIDSAGHRGDLVERLMASDFSGGFVCYSPARSLSTGEANLTSRGYFDAMDRPPIGYWLQATTRRSESRQGHSEIAILAWVPPAELDYAEAGVAACRSGSLALLPEISPELARQIQTLIAGDLERSDRL